uniref:Uncharacterized protein n=1 Tax=Trichogramma kaykai TaxID=54128 RepID=A0ABD2X0D3_9HYME
MRELVQVCAHDNLSKRGRERGRDKGRSIPLIGSTREYYAAELRIATCAYGSMQTSLADRESYNALLRKKPTQKVTTTTKKDAIRAMINTRRRLNDFCCERRYIRTYIARNEVICIDVPQPQCNSSRILEARKKNVCETNLGLEYGVNSLVDFGEVTLAQEPRHLLRIDRCHAFFL